MVKTKKFKEEGQIIEIEEAQLPVMEISQNQAKKLTKKPMSEKQQENVNRLIEANRQKWALQKTAMKVKEEKQADSKIQVVVKPKRVYPSRKKVAQAPPSESESESEESEESEESDNKYQKQKAKPKPKARKQENKKNELTEKLDELESRIKENQNNTVGFRFFNR
jgi:hypothetical protein